MIWETEECCQLGPKSLFVDNVAELRLVVKLIGLGVQ